MKYCPYCGTGLSGVVSFLSGMRSGTAQIFCYITLREESVDEVCTQKSFCIREWEIHGIELSGILLSV